MLQKSQYADAKYNTFKIAEASIGSGEYGSVHDFVNQAATTTQSGPPLVIKIQQIVFPKHVLLRSGQVWRILEFSASDVTELDSSLAAAARVRGCVPVLDWKILDLRNPTTAVELASELSTISRDAFARYASKVFVLTIMPKLTGFVPFDELVHTAPIEQSVNVVIAVVGIAQNLQKLGYKHIDIHGGNILVNPKDTGDIRLIDYDHMWHPKYTWPTNGEGEAMLCASNMQIIALLWTDAYFQEQNRMFDKYKLDQYDVKQFPKLLAKFAHELPEWHWLVELIQDDEMAFQIFRGAFPFEFKQFVYGNKHAKEVDLRHRALVQRDTLIMCGVFFRDWYAVEDILRRRIA
jgi:hypothetical protein